MKARTNNMVGITDHLEMGKNFKPEGVKSGGAYFKNEEHQEFYQKMIIATGSSVQNTGRLALFYLLASLDKVRERPEKYFFFQKMKPNPRAFKELAFPGEKALLQLALSFYSEKELFKIGVLDLFNNLDKEEARIAITAIKLKYSLEMVP